MSDYNPQAIDLLRKIVAEATRPGERFNLDTETYDEHLEVPASLIDEIRALLEKH